MRLISGGPPETVDFSRDGLFAHSSCASTHRPPSGLGIRSGAAPADDAHGRMSLPAKSVAPVSPESYAAPDYAWLWPSNDAAAGIDDSAAVDD